MSRVLALFTAAALLVLVCTVATTFITAKARVQKVDLGNGRTLHRIRQSVKKANHNNNNNKVGEPTIPDPTGTTAPPFVQPKRMIFVISDYCNKSLHLDGEPKVNDGGFVIYPPAEMSSAFSGQEYTGFEVASNPGQKPYFNGTFDYKMDNNSPVDNLNVAFFAAPDEFGMDCVSATVWKLFIYSSEYSDYAVYNVLLGHGNGFDKPIC